MEIVNYLRNLRENSAFKLRKLQTVLIPESTLLLSFQLYNLPPFVLECCSGFLLEACLIEKVFFGNSSIIFANDISLKPLSLVMLWRLCMPIVPL